MNLKYLIFLIFLSLSACVGYRYTDEGGVRVNNPRVFKYNRERFKSRDKSLIDTNAIYVMTEFHSNWDSLWFIRFFSTGQVLFIPCDSTLPKLDLINNRNVGIPGYFILKGNKIKINEFQQLNGGQTGKRFGRIESDGSIIFYEVRPETWYSIFSLVEKHGRENKSHWKKVKLDKIENYTPDW